MCPVPTAEDDVLDAGATARPPARRKWRGARPTGWSFAGLFGLSHRRSYCCARVRPNCERPGVAGWRRPGLGAIPRRISTQSPTETLKEPKFRT